MDKLYITRVWLDGHQLFAMTEGERLPIMTSTR